jgi:hypothetical protein
MSDLDRYLREVRERIPRVPMRGRFLAEAEAHIREAAAKDGVDAALEEFGPPEVVAAGVRRELAQRARHLSPVVVLAACVGFVVPLYAVPENVLPPAPWAAGAMPDTLEWKRDLVVGLLAAAGALAPAAAVARSTRVAALALTALAVASVVSVVLAVEWSHRVPGVPLTRLLVLSVTSEFALLVVATAALFVPRRLVR